MARTWIRPAVIAVFVLGIAGMITGSLAHNNNGAVVASGLVTAAAALVLLAVNAAAPPKGLRTIDEALAARVERRVDELVAGGADETAVRDLVRDAIRLGRSAS